MVDPDPATRRSLAGLCRDAADRGATAFVTINNKAEGSAPLSALALAREIAGLPAPERPPRPAARPGISAR
jgi:hypothetical protein